MKFGSFLASHARVMGAKDAVVCQGSRLTFAELEASSNRIARALRQQGVAVGDRLAVYLPNGIEFVQAFIGITKAGALVVPINLPLSAPEIAHMLSDCTPRAIFINEQTQAMYGRATHELPGSAPILRIGCDESCPADFRLAEIASQGDSTPLDIPFDADACMVAYTSGTTGRAKGVVLTQSNYLFVNGYLNGYYWGLNAQDRQICTTPLAHRTGMARMMNMILHGSTLIAMPYFNAQEAARLVREERITVFGMVPTVARMMLPEVEACPEDFASVRVMLATGEAFPLEVKRRLHEALPQVRIYSFYAMTEAGAITNLDASEQFTHPTSVGRPWPGVDVKLIGSDGGEVAAGEVGEIWVRSGMPGYFSSMREYYRRPEATAEILVDGWVVTGDMGRFDADGYLYLVDRKKDMVLSGGYNIYSMEVELALQSHPAVAHAAVIGVPDPVFGESVAAYVELNSGAAIDAQALIDHCRERIASYKKPKYVIFVRALPRTGTGKVMKGVLREQFRNQAH